MTGLISLTLGEALLLDKCGTCLVLEDNNILSLMKSVLITIVKIPGRDTSLHDKAEMLGTFQWKFPYLLFLKMNFW